MKNCGLRFHTKIAQKEFLNDMLRVLNPKVSSPMRQIKQQVLVPVVVRVPGAIYVCV